MSDAKRTISPECRCGNAVYETMNQYYRTSDSRYSEKLLADRLENLKNRVQNMGDKCKIEVGEPIRWITLFQGGMDSIGYRGKPEEGLNYYEIDLDNYIQAIGNSIEDSIKQCEEPKSPLKIIKK